jgi:hypothetical protein
MHANGDNACDVPAYVDENVSTKVIKLIQTMWVLLIKWYGENKLIKYHVL